MTLAAAATGHGAVSTILLALAFVLVAAKLAGELVERLGQPAVLGELLVGIALGNAALLGLPDASPLAASETFTVLAELGAVLLLFHVGLESTPKEMMAVGGRATLVAIVGVVTPMLLGGARHDAARRGGPDLRRNRGATRARRPSGDRRGHLCRRRLHGRGDHDGDPAAAVVVRPALARRARLGPTTLTSSYTCT